MESARFHFLFENFLYCVLLRESGRFVVYYNKYIF